MYIDGCEPYLGCTIILSGPVTEELKIVKKAMQKMLTTARVLLLEKEYFTFIQCDITRVHSHERTRSKSPRGDSISPLLPSKTLGSN